MKKKYGLISLCLLPFAVSCAIAYFFNTLQEKSLINIAKRQYYEKIELTYNLLYEIEQLQISCRGFETDVLFNNFIIKAVESIDRQYGIYGRVIDLEGRLLSRPNLAENEPGLAVLLEADDYDFFTDLGFVRDIPRGDRHIVSRNGVKIHLHWLRYPVANEHYYYILLGIVYDRVLDTIDFNAFAVGIILMVLMLVVEFYCIVYNWSQNLKYGRAT